MPNPIAAPSLTTTSSRNGRPPGSRSSSWGALVRQAEKQVSVKHELLADPLLSLREAALVLGVSCSTIRKMVHRGDLKNLSRTSQPRGHLRVRLSECKRAVAALAVTP